MTMNTAERFLTIISLCTGILIALGTLIWKLGRFMNNLAELPDEVKEVIAELKKMNDRIGEVRSESAQWRRDHLKRDHPRRGREPI